MALFTVQQPRTSDALIRRLLWFVAVLMLGTIALGFHLVMVFVQQLNDEARHGETSRMISAVGQKTGTLNEILGSLSGYHSSDRVQFLTLAAPHFDFVGVFDRSEAGGSVDWVATPSAEAALSLRHALPYYPFGDHASQQLFVDEGQIFVRVAFDLSPSRLLIGEHVLDPEWLVSNAGLSSVSGFDVLEGELPDTKNAVSVRDAVTGAVVSLAWEWGAPGHHFGRMALIVVGPALLFIVLLFALVAVNTRRIADELAASQAAAETLAGLDPLSGLPNRLFFGERLDQELAGIDDSGPGLALLFLDLDRFKDVNDAHGHQAGDELIKQVARRLLTVLRGADTLSRFGGDEFAIIQPGITHAGDAEELAQKVMSALRTPFMIDGISVDIGVSIGMALAPRHARDRETLMRLADTALYDAKSCGRNRFSLFGEQMDEEIRMRKLVADDLRTAIRDDLLTLFYQPIYSAAGDRVVSLEALVRWPHPTKGMIPPAKFIPLAEQSGLIIPLGEWVLKRACRDGRRWPGTKIAVNVSPIQFRQKDFVDCVLSIVKGADFDPSQIELELTEGVVVEDADAAEAAMKQLRAHGFNLALDDFGSGYSSLIYLRRFAFDKIKIDRAFLGSMEGTGEDAILVHSIVHLGRALGLTVTAEGVETKEQRRFLQALGCHELQGYLFSRPLPVEAIDELLNASEGLTRPTSAAG